MTERIHQPLSAIYGKKGPVKEWDKTVYTSQLSPEELEQYRNGEKGGRKMVTFDDYKKLKDTGKSDKEIAKALGFSTATLYNRLKVWKGEALKSVGKPQNLAEIEQVTVAATKDSGEGSNDLREQFKRELEEALTEKDKLIAELRNELINWKQTSLKWEEAATTIEVPDAFEDAMAAVEQLKRENTVLESRLESAEHLREQSRRMYSELLNKFTAMKEELEPLRKLAFLKLKKDVEA